VCTSACVCACAPVCTYLLLRAGATYRENVSVCVCVCVCVCLCVLSDTFKYPAASWAATMNEMYVAVAAHQSCRELRMFSFASTHCIALKAFASTHCIALKARTCIDTALVHPPLL